MNVYLQRLGAGKKLKIGIFGGTFNPIHHGHLINAQIVKDYHSLDRILFVPSKNPVHKNLHGNVSSEDRFTMVNLAIQNNNCFEAVRIELDRDEASYTITTIKALKAKYKSAEFFLIIGADAFNELDTWKDYKELSEMTAFIVMARSGTEIINKDIAAAVKKIIISKNKLIDISSSQIREHIKKGYSIKYLVPDKVEEYILNKELYRG